MISHKYKLIFIHLEKAGGTSLEDVFTYPINWWNMKNKYLLDNSFDEGRLKHVSYPYAEIIYKNHIIKYHKITIVRHPYSLFISRLNWNGVRGKITRDDIDKVIKTNKQRWKIDYLHEFLGNPDNYDFIIRFETYADDYKEMLKKLNLPESLKLKHIYRQNHKTCYKNITLTDEAKSRIKEYCLEYCRLYNYEL